MLRPVGRGRKPALTVSNLETHVFSTEDVLAKVRAAEDARRPRGQRGPGEDLVRDALMALEPYWAEYIYFQD